MIRKEPEKPKALRPLLCELTVVVAVKSTEVLAPPGVSDFE